MKMISVTMKWGIGVLGMVLLFVLAGAISSSFSFASQESRHLPWTLKTFPDGHKEFGPAYLWKRGGINVLYLKGTPYERGLQHGTLLREESRRGVIPYLATKLDEEVRKSSAVSAFPGLKSLLMFYADWFVFRRIYRQIPKIYAQGVRGISDGSGLSEVEYRRAIAMPDAMAVLAKTLYGRYLMESVSKTFGCSSFVVFGPATASGRLLHARNLDFPGVGLWDRSHTLLYVEPDQGLKHVVITAAGVHTAGVTSTNEMGLIYSLHQNFTSNVSPNGTPVVNIGEEIITKARNLDEAIAIIRASSFAASWTFVLSHVASPQKAIVVEMSPDHVEIRSAQDNRIAATNVNLSPSLREKQIFFNRSVEEDNICRYKRILDLLEEKNGKLTPASAAEILGDRFDLLTGRVRSVGRTISSVYNIQSAVFDPQKGRFWISNGDAPANTGDFIGFTFEEGFHPSTFSQKISDRLRGTRFREDPRLPGVKAYIAAYQAYFDQKDLAKAYSDILDAILIDPQETAYFIVAGLLALKREQYEAARDHLTHALGVGGTTHQERVIALYLGRTYDLLRERNLAIEWYREGLKGEGIDPRLKEALKEGLESPFIAKQMKKIVLQLDYADTMGY